MALIFIVPSIFGSSQLLASFVSLLHVICLISSFHISFNVPLLVLFVVFLFLVASVFSFHCPFDRWSIGEQFPYFRRQSLVARFVLCSFLKFAGPSVVR